MTSRVAAFFSRKNTFDFVLLALVLCIAAGLRFYRLDSLPNGFHGDEAASGLEGERILREGFIGPYTHAASGEPTGPLYLTALAIRLFGASIWSVRAVSALVGTLTVAICYFLVRHCYQAPEIEKRTVAFLCTVFLATLHWHLLYSRIGFPIVVWPLCTLLSVGALIGASQRQQARWWGMAGLLLGAGIYVYNAHILCIAALGLWTLLYLGAQSSVPWTKRGGWLLAFFGALGFVSLPMLRYAANPDNYFFDHAQMVSVFNEPSSGWNALPGLGAKIVFLAERDLDFWNNLSFHPRVDLGDGSGVTPVVPMLLLALCLFGLVGGLKNKRGPLVTMSLLLALFLPLGPATTLDGLTRRAFALAPFVSFLASVGLVELYLFGRARERRVRVWGVPQGVALLGVVSVFEIATFQNLHSYFVQTPEAEPVQWTYGRDMKDACLYLQTLPWNARVYLYSERWSSNYDTIAFLCPRIAIEDHSREFGTYTLTPDLNRGAPYFLLLGRYRSKLGELQRLYPNAHVYKGSPMLDGQPSFIAVSLQ